MENFQSDLYGRTGTVQVKSGMSIDSHLERCLLVQTAELYSSAVWTKRHLSRWESMDIPDLTCTVPVRPYRSL